MNGANHDMQGLSTYPFYIFGQGWEQVELPPDVQCFKRDTVIAQLEQIAWWHWDAAKISQCLPHIVAADIHALQGSAG